ncbi:exonuclease I, putative [Plasmodium ovale wallikeri]|uniref:Exonuclease 1 n=1 Tax=Plasmodium ovale wallikeri TaxID=864142 RepID=A0A1A8YIS2_PLAOA|nr:exonuclease I, putative [Plasmodium ovale wallikeri]
MGISNLLQFLKPIVKNSHISKYKNEVIGVDIMCWIHRGLISCAYDIVTDNFNDSYLNFIEKMLETLNHYNIKVVFVFDGEELPEKKKENLLRKSRREKAKKEAQEIIKKVKNPRTNETVLKKCIQALSVSKEIIESVIQFCKKKNIDYIISPYEADAQLSYLCRMGFISCVISEDSDLLVYGCPRVLYKLKNNGECNEISLLPINDLIDVNIIRKIKNPLSDSFNGFYITPVKQLSGEECEDNTIDGDSCDDDAIRRKHTDKYSIEKIGRKHQEGQNYGKIMKDYLDNFHWPEELEKLKYFDIDMFLAMCILSGCDYTNDFHITGMGIKTAFNLIYQYKNIKNIFSFLITHERWKHKIPNNLNTLEKLMGKYEEIKNAFLQHQVYDFILCQNIPIQQSFNSTFKKRDNNIFINRITEFSLAYNQSKKRDNCLNAYSHYSANNDTFANFNLTPKKEEVGEVEEVEVEEVEVEVEEEVEAEAEAEEVEAEEEENMEKKTLLMPKKVGNKNENLYTCKPNEFENIFKNFTTECFEYLEISPDVFRNDEKYDTDKIAPGGKSILGENATYMNQSQTQSTLRNLTNDIQNNDVSVFNISPEVHKNGTILGDIHRSSDTFFKSSFHAICEKPNGEPARHSDRKRNTKLCAAKRKIENTTTFNFKKRKEEPIVPSVSGNVCTDLTEKDETNCCKLPFNGSKNCVHEWQKAGEKSVKSVSADVSANASADVSASVSADESADESANVSADVRANVSTNSSSELPTPGGTNNPKTDDEGGGSPFSKDDHTNESSKKGKMKSAKDMYENMRKNFLLFKTLDRGTITPLNVPEEEENSKNELIVRVEGCSHEEELQYDSANVQSTEKQSFVMANEIYGSTSEMLPEEETKKNSKTENESYICNEDKGRINSNDAYNNMVKGEKNEMVKTSYPLEYNQRSPFSSSRRNRTPVKNDRNKNQLRITNFFKKIDKRSNEPVTNTTLKSGINENSSNNIKQSALISKCTQLTEERTQILNYANNSTPKNEVNTTQDEKDNKLKKEIRENDPEDPKQLYNDKAQDEDYDDHYLYLATLHLESNPLENEYLMKLKKIASQNRNTPNMSVQNRSQNEDEMLKNSHPRQEGKNMYSSKLTQISSDTISDKKYNVKKENEKKEKSNDLNLEYILKNLNYNYQPKNHKINTFDYFKEKENVTPHNPYMDNL